MSLSVQVERYFNAPPEKLFEAWTKAEVLSQWFGTRVEADPVVGGSIRIHFDAPDGANHGKYVVVDPYTHVAFTWNARGGDTPPDTTVHVYFTAEGAGTRLLLRHEGFTTKQSFEPYDEGWLTFMDLWALRTNLVPRGQPAATTAVVVGARQDPSASFSAWLDAPTQALDIVTESDGARVLRHDNLVARWKPCDYGTSLAIGQWGFDGEESRLAARSVWRERLNALATPTG